MRALNEEEKAFLNSFYEEAVNSNFLHDPELRSLHNEIKEIEEIKNPTEEDIERHSYLKLLFFDREDEVLLYPGDKAQKKIYGENNARNRCIYSRAKASGNLYELNSETYGEDDGSDSELFLDEAELRKRK